MGINCIDISLGSGGLSAVLNDTGDSILVFKDSILAFECTKLYPNVRSWHKTDVVQANVRYERKAEIGSFSLFDRVVMQSRIDQK